MKSEHARTGAASADEDAIVDFFRALPAAARREYEVLAELDGRFGEDVEAERQARGDAPSRLGRG